MSNELATVQQQYAELFKPKAKLSNPYFNKLRVHVTKGVGKTPTTGQVVLELQDKSVVRFAKPVNLILTSLQTQFRRGRQGKEKFENVSKSVILPQFSSEPYISTDGSIKCGQIPTSYESATKTKLHKGTTTPLSKEELALNAQVTYTLDPFGLVDISQGILEDGSTAPAGSFVPCVLHVSKGTLMSVQKGIKDIYKEAAILPELFLTVGVGKCNKVGTNEFFDYALSNGGKAPTLPIVAETARGLNDYIAQENDFVAKAHAKAQAGDVGKDTDFYIDGDAVEETEE